MKARRSARAPRYHRAKGTKGVFVLVKPNPVKPLAKLSRGALEALVKLLVVRTQLVPSQAGWRYYDELRKAGYAYGVMSTGGFIINHDRLDDGAIKAAVGLGPKGC